MDPQKAHTFNTSFWVPVSLDDVWSYFSNAKNLEQLSPSFYGIKVLGDGIFNKGSTLEMTLNPLGLPLGLKWRAKILDRVSEGPGRYFIDLQESGPFAYWKHTHIFQQGTKEIKGERSGALVKATQPGTWLIDKVEYSPPKGTDYKIINHLVIEKSLAKMFLYRKNIILQHFGS